MSMSEEVRRRLSENSLKKRREHPKPHDYADCDWLVACDYAMEHEHHDHRWGYLRWFPAATIGLIQEHLPHQSDKIDYYDRQMPGSGQRTVILFPLRLLVPLLQFLRLNADRYYRVHETKETQS